MNVTEYARILWQLLPPGKLWKVIGGAFNDLLLGTAEECVRVDERGQLLYFEADPRTTNELLTDFEAEYGFDSEGTLEERRARVYARDLAQPELRPADYQEMLAPLLGQDAEDVVVLERTAAWAASVGDQREIYRFFIYRDPGEPGSYDLAAAHALVDDVEHSHTKGYVIESIDFLCDDEFSLCDRDLLGE